mmetsp:Transcript_21066/g.33767  ORF Transcript_21066/g.33767 Transcript_21066/m.33767 type:complete len:415 (+) Transcript_21066:291-1535(+)
MRKVLFSAESEFNWRTAHLIGNLRSQFNILELQTMSKTAAHEVVYQLDLLRLVPRNLSHLILQHAWNLVPSPNGDLVVLNKHGRVERFQRRMRHIRHTVCGFHCLSACQGFRYVAFIAPFFVKLVVIERCLNRRPMTVLLRRIRRLTPIKVNRLHRLNGPPCVVGHHGDSATDLNHLLHTPHTFGGACVIAVECPALTGVTHHRRMHHAVDVHIDTVAQRASGFRHHVKPLHRLANQTPLRRFPQRYLCDRLHFCRFLSQRRVGELRPIRELHRAICGFQLRNRYATHARRRQLQGFPRHRASLTQLLITVRHRRGPTSDLHTKQLDHAPHKAAGGFGCEALIRRHKRRTIACQGAVPIGFVRLAKVDFELTKLYVQFFRNQSRLCMRYALPFIPMRRNQGDFLTIDNDPRIKR